MRLVIDTNIWVSHLLLPGSVRDRVVRLSLAEHVVLMSQPLLEELAQTLQKPRLQSVIPEEARLQLLYKLSKIVTHVPLIAQVQLCRDPSDDRVLETALNGSAEAILSGDKDLLTLHPFGQIAIWSAAHFLQNTPSQNS